MDTVAVRRKPNPHNPNWIVGSGTNDERPFRLDAFELVLGIVPVVRVTIYRDDLERANRRGLSSLPTVAG